jgi:hypothetical protein
MGFGVKVRTEFVQREKQAGQRCDDDQAGDDGFGSFVRHVAFTGAWNEYSSIRSSTLRAAPPLPEQL